MSTLQIKPRNDTDQLKIQTSGGNTTFFVHGSGATLKNSTIENTNTFPAGMIVQVLQTLKTDKESVAGSATTGSTGQDSWAFIPAQGGGGVFQQGITVTGSNKVLINLSINLGMANANYAVFLALFRGSTSDTGIGSCTKIGAGTEPTGNQSSAIAGGTIGNSTAEIHNYSPMILDTPGAGTHFYKVAWMGEVNGTYTINSAGSDDNYAYRASLSSSITLMEIQA